MEIRAKARHLGDRVWTDEIQTMLEDAGRSGDGEQGVPRRPQGPDRLPDRCYPAHATSVLFIIPWDDHWIIGTTDTPWKYDKQHPAATSADIDYLLDTVNESS